MICRELTKLHEEYLRGTLGELTEYLAENTLKGECCLLVSGFTGEKETIAKNAYFPQGTCASFNGGRGTEFQRGNQRSGQIEKCKKQEVYKEYHSI